MKHKPTKAKRDKSNRDDEGILVGCGQCVMLVGDIVSGFEAYGPFACGSDAVRWKQGKGARELTQGQWYLMALKTPMEV